MSGGTIPAEQGAGARDHGIVRFLRRNLHNIGMPVAVLLLCIVFAATSEYFLTVQNFRNIGLQAAALAAVAFGQTLVVLTGGLDLSVGSVVALVSVVSALAMIAFGVPVGILLGLATGAAIGLVNGLVVTRLRVFPFIATLAMLSIAAGLALNISGGTPVAGVPREFAVIAWTRVAGVPVPLLVSLILLALVFLFLRYHRVGRDIYAVGGNAQAARLSGIATDRAIVMAYTLSSLCAAVGSLILTARVGSGQPTLGTSLPLESVAAVVLGGVSLFGGRGAVINVAMGVAFVSVLSNGLNLLNVSSYTQMMVIGLALILAVALDRRFAVRD